MAARCAVRVFRCRSRALLGSDDLIRVLRSPRFIGRQELK